ncbi:MAG: alpha-2-macroglobulin, partial [Armatimonadota bacterium]
MKHLRMLIIGVAVLITLLVTTRIDLAISQDVTPRDTAVKQMQNGNWKDAYEGYSKLALNPKDDPMKVSDDLSRALQCLRNLGRVDEVDDFRETVIARHSTNWRLLFTAAQSYQNYDHYGYIVGGNFSRGRHRGGGRYVSCHERDRVRALQLMSQAVANAQNEPNRTEVASFYWSLSEMMMGNRGYYGAWRLQYLTDLTKLPDYDENGGNDGGRGAPVNADGTPVYFNMPTSWLNAKNDGERWRWALQQTALMNPGLDGQVKYTFAGFLQSQFGVQTMAQYRWYFNRSDDDDKKNESGPYDLFTLSEKETIARLATGIKRFTLPDEFNFIKIYQQLADTNTNKETHYYNGNQLQAIRMLAQIFEDRRQYDRAAGYWKRVFEISKHESDQRRLNQILGNWGQFEPVTTNPPAP